MCVYLCVGVRLRYVRLLGLCGGVRCKYERVLVVRRIYMCTCVVRTVDICAFIFKVGMAECFRPIHLLASTRKKNGTNI